MARATRGADPVVGATRVELLPIHVRSLTVTRTLDVTPLMRRVFVSGPEITGFPFEPMTPTAHVKVFFPQPDTGEIVAPRIDDSGWHLPEDSPAPIYRDYTVRGYDPDSNELALDFVLHDHGVAGRWAGQAQPGDPITVAGPRGHAHFPTGYARYVVAGDETALPAVSRFVEELPADVRVTAIIEVAAESEIQPITGPADADVRWLIRNPERGDLIEQEIRGLGLSADDSVFVFAAGEANMLKPIRRYLRRELGLPAHQCEVDGYWKKGTVNLDHHVDDEDD